MLSQHQVICLQDTVLSRFYGCLKYLKVFLLLHMETYPNNQKPKSLCSFTICAMKTYSAIISSASSNITFTLNLVHDPPSTLTAMLYAYKYRSLSVNSALMCFGPSGPPAWNTLTSFSEIKTYICTQDYHISDLLLNTLVTYKRPCHNIKINEPDYTTRPTEETFYST
jgi:hypothetical protein